MRCDVVHGVWCDAGYGYGVRGLGAVRWWGGALLGVGDVKRGEVWWYERWSEAPRGVGGVVGWSVKGCGGVSRGVVGRDGVEGVAEV